MVEGGRHLHDAVTQPDAFRPLRTRGEKHLGRRGVRVLFEKMMLDFPRAVEAQPIGELDLI